MRLADETASESEQPDLSLSGIESILPPSSSSHFSIAAVSDHQSTSQQQPQQQSNVIVPNLQQLRLNDADAASSAGQADTSMSSGSGSSHALLPAAMVPFYGGSTAGYNTGSLYSEPSTPTTATSLASSSFLPAYNPYLSPTIEFNMFWNTPWPFAAEVVSQFAFNELGSPLTEVAQYPGGHFGSSAANQFASRLPQITQPIPGCLPAAAAAQFMTRGNSVSGYPGRSNTTTVARKGGRRPREAEEEESMDLTEDDLQKRNKRRQRNKEAAARCRKRRLDLMTQLSDQVEQLKGQNRNLQIQVDSLMQEKNKLVELLRNHDCHASKELRDALGNTSNNQLSHMAQFNDMQQQPYMVPLKHSPPSVHDSGDELGKADEYKQGDYTPVTSALDMPFTTTSNNPLLNDPVISSASYDEPLQKRLKSEETPDENNGLTKRPTSLFNGFAPMRQGVVGNTPGFPPFATPSAMFEASTPSNGLDHNFGGALGNGPTFLTPVASGPISVTPSNPPQSNDIQSL